MPTTTTPVVEVSYEQPDKFGLTDGRFNRRFGYAASWDFQNRENWLLDDCEVWTRKRPGASPSTWITTRRVFPTANMVLANWAKIGAWEELAIKGRTWLHATRSDGGNSTILSNQGTGATQGVMGTSGALALWFIVSAPTVSDTASVEVELVGQWLLKIPTHGFDPQEFQALRAGRYERAALVEPLEDTVGRTPDAEKRFSLAITWVNGTVFVQKDGGEQMILADRLNLVPGHGKLRIRFIATSGAVFGGDATWKTLGVARPRRGVMPGRNRSTAFQVRMSRLLPTGGDAVTAGVVIGSYYPPASGQYDQNNITAGLTPATYLPVLKLTGLGTSTPIVSAVSIYSVNEKLLLTPVTTSLSSVVSGRVCLRRRGSEGHVTAENQASAFLPKNGSFYLLKGMEDDGIASVANWCRLIGRIDQVLHDRQPYLLQEIRIHLGDWSTHWLPFCRMENMPSFVGWTMHQMVDYVLTDRWNIPASAVIKTGLVNVLLDETWLARLNFHPALDGNGFLNAISKLVRAEWIIKQPAHEIRWYYPFVAPSVSFFMDDTTNSDDFTPLNPTVQGDEIQVVSREINSERIVSNAVVISRDAAGRPRSGEYQEPRFLDTGQKPYIGGVAHFEVDDVDTPISPGLLAYRMVGLPEGLPVNWSSERARFGTVFPGDTGQVTSVQQTNLVSGDQFLVDQKEITFDGIKAAMEVNGRQFIVFT